VGARHSKVCRAVEQDGLIVSRTEETQIQTDQERQPRLSLPQSARQMLPLLASYCPALPPRDGPRHFNFLSESGLIAGCGSAVPADSGQGQCSGRGVCIRDATHTSQGTCKCNAPWKGRYCDFVECPSYGCAAALVNCPGCEPVPHLL
jgi:hypothetical protein